MIQFDPEDMKDGRHVLSDEGWCWCQPRVEPVLPFGEDTVHRHFMDRPEYEDAPDAE